MLSAAQENSPMSVVQALDRVLVRMILLTDCINFLMLVQIKWCYITGGTH